MQKDPYWLNFLPFFFRKKITGRVSYHAVIQNTAWLMLDKLVRILIGLFVGAWLARYLGPQQFGELSYVLAYIAFFQAITSFGLDGIVVRDITQDKASAPNILGTAFVIRFWIGFICWICAVSSMAWMNGISDDSVSLIAISGGTLVFQSVDTIDLWFQSQSESRRTVCVKLISYSLSTGAKVLLIISQASLIYFTVILVMESLISALGLMIAYKSFKTDSRWVALSTKAKAMARESWPYTVSGISIMVYMRIDQIMLKNMIGERELGLYAAMLPISQVWHVIPMTVVASIAPYVAKFKAESEEKYIDVLQTVFRMLCAIAMLASIITSFFSGFAIEILYGQDFMGASDALAIHVFSNVFISLGVAQSLWQINEYRSRISLYKTLIGAVISIGCNILLIPFYGITGAAISSVTAQFFSAFLSNIIYEPRIYKMQLFSIFQIKSV